VERLRPPDMTAEEILTYMMDIAALGLHREVQPAHLETPRQPQSASLAAALNRNRHLLSLGS
jgi:hypothetical protein